MTSGKFETKQLEQPPPVQLSTRCSTPEHGVRYLDLYYEYGPLLSVSGTEFMCLCYDTGVQTVNLYKHEHECFIHAICYANC